jgi:two-component system cell cycle response regulator DivK
MKPRILLVEDDRLIGYIAQRVLQRAGYEVALASGGRHALDLAVRRKPDLILLALEMPDMDGYETARLLRALPSLARVPMVATSAHAQVMEGERAMQAGFAGYLEKPFRPTTLPQQLAGYLPARNSGSPP